LLEHDANVNALENSGLMPLQPAGFHSAAVDLITSRLHLLSLEGDKIAP
jgi:hypothetical protein